MSLAPAPMKTDARSTPEWLAADSLEGYLRNSFLPKGLSVLAAPESKDEGLHCEAAEQVADSDYFRGVLDPVTGFLRGSASLPYEGSPEKAAERLYLDLLDFVSDALPERGRLYRVWNYVPQINESVEGLENYRWFNRGRWSAFEAVFGEGKMERELPAASAVGLETGEPGKQLNLSFHAGAAPVSYFENPLQTPAYHYPSDYGPKSPGFARGASVQGGLSYLSGTASIRGHKTVGEGDLLTQCETSLANMRAVLDEMGIEEIAESSVRELRVYLRKRGDLDRVRDWLSEALGDSISHAKTTYIEADICRASLDFEIEGVFQ